MTNDIDTDKMNDLKISIRYKLYITKLLSFEDNWPSPRANAS